jgi:voltage-gated potassium channel
MLGRFTTTRLPLRRATIAIAAVLSLFLLGSAGYWLLGAGAWSGSDCLYMTAITMSTVGFREVLPIGDDPVLRAYTILVIFAGGGSMIYLLSIVTATLVEGDLNQYIRRRRMDKAIEHLSGHYVVCGIGRTGEHTAARLVASGFDVVLVDRAEDKVQAFLDAHGRRTPFVIGDAIDEAVLRRAGVDRAKGLVAALPEDQDNLFLILSTRQLNPIARIVGKANEKRSRDKFLQVGASAVVSPVAMGGLRMFSELVRPGVTSFLDYVLHETDEDLGIDEVPVTAGSALAGKRLADSEIRQRTNLLVVGVRDDRTGRFTYNPGPDFRLSEGTTLIVLGPSASITELSGMGRGA